jgi:hypothetical protein
VAYFIINTAFSDRWDHLSAIIIRIVELEPEDAVTYFEEISKIVKIDELKLTIPEVLRRPYQETRGEKDSASTLSTLKVFKMALDGTHSK